MKKKLILFGIVCVFLYFVTPNVHFVQKFGMKFNKHIDERNEIDLSLYRNKPHEYFEIIKDKQNKNATNYHIEYDTNSHNVVYDRKDSYQRQFHYDKKTGAGDLFEISKGNTYYPIPAETREKFGFILKMTNPDKNSNPMFSFHTYIPKISSGISSPKYMYRKYPFGKENPCSVWQTINKVTNKNPKTGYSDTYYTTSEYCVDEDLGIFYYSKTYNPRMGGYNYAFDTRKFEINNVKDDVFLIPKEIKFIINLGFLKSIKK